MDETRMNIFLVRRMTFMHVTKNDKVFVVVFTVLFLPPHVQKYQHWYPTVHKLNRHTSASTKLAITIHRLARQTEGELCFVFFCLSAELQSLSPTYARMEALCRMWAYSSTLLWLLSHVPAPKKFIWGDVRFLSPICLKNRKNDTPQRASNLDTASTDPYEQLHQHFFVSSMYLLYLFVFLLYRPRSALSTIAT